MKTVKKAVIPAAGLGTRFLPATKSTPKELLTIVDKPLLLYIVEEAVRAGIEDIVFVAGRGKSSIEDFFDCSYEVEDTLLKQGKSDLLDKISNIKNMCNVISVRQKQALGLGHAVGCAKPVVGDEPFAVLLGDEVMISETDQPTATGQLCELYNQRGLSAVAVMEVERSQVSKYGIVDASEESSGLYKVNSVIEKPQPESAPSQLALPGRYVFDGSIFESLKNVKPGKNGEIQLTDAMTDVAQKQGMLATTFSAKRYDAGDKLGFLQANVELALSHPEIGDDFKKYLKHYCASL